MLFADIHNHCLASVDDGATSEEMMYQMLDAAYADGTRLLCLTPHFYPGIFGDNREATLENFIKLRDYANQHYPQLQLYLGNELRYSPNCDAWLKDGLCRTLNETNAVLVDFPADASQNLITRGLEQLLSRGYLPVLAHAERYSSLSADAIRDFRRNGIRIQINAGSLTGSWGWSTKLRARRLLRKRLVCMVSSDAHDLTYRTPLLSRSHRITQKITDEDYADLLFYRNAVALLETNREGLVKEDE